MKRALLDVSARKAILVRPPVVMTARTIRGLAVLQIDMAIAAIKLAVHFIKLKTGNHVVEILLVPAAVAVRALVAELADLFAGRVTGATGQILVKPVQNPAAVGGMSESRFFFTAMTLAAVVLYMTVITDCVNLFVGFTYTGFLL